jgi:hypothetical protein
MNYLKLIVGSFLLISWVACGGLYAKEFVFTVKQDRLWDGKGTLIIAAERIEFRAEKAKDARRWSYPDIKGIDIVSPRKLLIKTYESQVWRLGADRAYSFQLLQGEITEEIYQFLLGKINKPITTRVIFSVAAPIYQWPVRHRHRLGGCQGVLKIAADRIVYETEQRTDRRIWFYKDIESVGSSGPFDLRITTYTETFTFDLKERLKEAEYTDLWERVNRMRIEH